MNRRDRPDLEISTRFEILAVLGEGGMGAVYAAFDRERRTRVALKTLTMLNADRLLLFKKEFRAIADLVHPNLVRLGELFEENGLWFFTMELVQGVDFLTYVRPLLRPASAELETSDEIAQSTSAIAREEADGGGPDAETLPAEYTDADGDTRDIRIPLPAVVQCAPDFLASSTFDESRLRATLSQLAAGLAAVHSAHKVHRDIKPSNLLITAEGRLVILDFGIISDLSLGEDLLAHRTMGTLQYMAPEQTMGGAALPAADLYAVGVMLFQALTGSLPFSGTPEQILEQKRYLEPPLAHTLVPEVPHDLNLLCQELLRLDPAARPSASQLKERLVHRQSQEEKAAPVGLTSDLFVGRKAEQEFLQDALQHAQRVQGLTVLVEGESGVGKSALVRSFLNKARSQYANLVVFTGRCYERESVHYKALDAVVDLLSVHLQLLPQKEAMALVPEEIARLAQVFPVLGPLAGLHNAVLPEISDAVELRRQAFSVFRTLLKRLAQHRPLVVVIDDLQWADSDSFVLLKELLQPPEPPAWLLLCTVRSQTTTSLGQGMGSTTLPGELRTLRIEKLPLEDAQALVVRLLHAELGMDAALHIAKEAQGHPLFIDELVRLRLEEKDTGGASVKRLDEVLSRRVLALHKTARHLVEVVAVAGVPIAQSVAAQAAMLEAAEFDSLVAELRAAHLLRTAGARPSDPIETYHDRVRESVLGYLTSEAQRTWHGRLAVTLEESGKAEPEALVTHWQGAGQPDRAAGYAVRAADQAAAALAFERAAALYKQALELTQASGETRRQLLVKRAEALVGAKRGREAALAFLEAAAGAPLEQASSLKQRAASYYLLSGYLQEGIALARSAMNDLELRFIENPWLSLFLGILYMIFLRFRGLNFRPRNVREIPAVELARIDLLRAFSQGIGEHEMMRTQELSCRFLLRALDAAEPGRLAAALCTHSIMCAVSGTKKGIERGEKIMATARNLAEQQSEPLPLAVIAQYEGTFHHIFGRWRAANDKFIQAERMLRERCHDVFWDIDQCVQLWMSNSVAMGEFAAAARRLPEVLSDAEARQDLILLSSIGTLSVPVLSLVADEPGRAREKAEEYMQKWSYPGPTGRAFNRHVWTAQSLLYEGRGREANSYLKREFHAGYHMMFRAAQIVRVYGNDILGRCEVAAACQADSQAERTQLLAQAAKRVKGLLADKANWSVALGHRLSASIAAARGESEQATAALLHAAETLSFAAMKIDAAALRWRLGKLKGGAEGQSLITAAENAMRTEGIVSPARWVEMLVPGF